MARAPSLQSGQSPKTTEVAFTSIWLRICLIFPCWFYRESITAGNICIFARGLKQMELQIGHVGGGLRSAPFWLGQREVQMMRSVCSAGCWPCVCCRSCTMNQSTSTIRRRPVSQDLAPRPLARSHSSGASWTWPQRSYPQSEFQGWGCLSCSVALFFLFFCGCPTKNGLPKKGVPFYSRVTEQLGCGKKDVARFVTVRSNYFAIPCQSFPSR